MMNKDLKYYKGIWYTRAYGRWYAVTKIFYNKDAKQNIVDANRYMDRLQTRVDGVLKTFNNDTIIILANVADIGKEILN